MQRVLIDACGWVACIDANLNIERDMEALIGPCTWVLLPSVETELIRLNEGRPKKNPSFFTCFAQRPNVLRPTPAPATPTTSFSLAPLNTIGRR